MINLNGKGVLITGGTGTFGSTLARYLLESQRPDRVVIFSRGEHRQADLRASIEELDDRGCLRFFIGDVRDEARLRMALRGITHVFHAAALKRIEACEYCPDEAVLTNIVGAKNLVHAAVDAGVERVLAISSDKAAGPTTLYGVTKLAMERVISAGNHLSGAAQTRFSSARYGNVIGSAGSVAPLFYEKMLAGEVLKVTDPRMTRFNWSVLDAAKFAMKAMYHMGGGEVFIPEMRAASVMDIVLALGVIVGKKADIEVVGPRHCEKHHEILLTEDEALAGYKDDGMFVIPPAGSDTSEKDRIPHGRYSSEHAKRHSRYDLVIAIRDALGLDVTL